MLLAPSWLLSWTLRSPPANKQSAMFNSPRHEQIKNIACASCSLLALILNPVPSSCKQAVHHVNEPTTWEDQKLCLCFLLPLGFGLEPCALLLETSSPPCLRTHDVSRSKTLLVLLAPSWIWSWTLCPPPANKQSTMFMNPRREQIKNFACASCSLLALVLNPAPSSCKRVVHHV